MCDQSGAEDEMREIPTQIRVSIISAWTKKKIDSLTIVLSQWFGGYDQMQWDVD